MIPLFLLFVKLNYIYPQNIIIKGTPTIIEIKVSGKSYMFCDVYDFKTATGKTIKTMESYVIAV